jgi:hypothetical protein
MAEKRFALIIASWDYTADLGLRKLIAPPQDAAALAQVLQDTAIGGFEVHILLNEPSPKVAEEIEAFFKERQRDDLALLYFSGHGVKDTNGQLYFAMPNTRRDLLYSTAIKAQVVNEMMRESRAQQKVLLLDCCYSGAFAKGMTVKADQSIGTRDYFDGRGLAILTASDALQYSFEEERVEGQGVQSVFTRILAQGLDKGEADTNGDGLITFDELYDYILDRIEQEAPKQKPRKWALDVQGKIVIARNPRPVIKPAQLPAELQQTTEDPRSWVREGAVHELGRLLQGSHPGLALGAYEALKRLAEDDSRRVATSAAEILAAYADVQLAKEKTEREKQDRLAAEKAEVERAAREKIEQERLAQDKAEAERIAALKAEEERLTHEKAEQEHSAQEKAEAEWFARRDEGFEPIPFDSPTADRPYGYALAPTGRVLLGKEKIPFTLIEHHGGNGHRIIEVRPPHANTNDAKEIRPAEVKNVEAIYVLLTAGDTHRTFSGRRFEEKEIGKLIVSFYNRPHPQVSPLRLGLEIREWVSGETRPGYDVVAKASEAEEVWQSPDRRHTIDMVCLKIEDGPQDVQNLVVVGECPWLRGNYDGPIPTIRISGVTYKTVGQAEAERLAALKAEEERIAREKAEAERNAALKAEEERIAQEKAEQERLARKKAEDERAAREKAEAEQLATQKAEEERLAREEAEAERIAALKTEEERIAREKAERERLAAEKAEQERLAAEKAKAKRKAREKAERERLVAEKAEQERLAAEKAEAKRKAREKAERERLAAEKVEQERLTREKAEQELFMPLYGQRERDGLQRYLDASYPAARQAELERKRKLRLSRLTETHAKQEAMLSPTEEFFVRHGVIVLMLVQLPICIAGAFLADWLLRWSLEQFHITLRPVSGGWVSLLIVGIMWGLVYMKPNHFLLGPYLDLFWGYDADERIKGLLTALPINILFAWGLAQGARVAALNFIGVGADWIVYLVFGLITLGTGVWHLFGTFD